jgi:hypothetical protein
MSYAMWNYLTAPLLFTYPGVESQAIEPWQEDGQTWCRFAVGARTSCLGVAHLTNRRIKQQFVTR